jgi:carbonic anhydrase
MTLARELKSSSAPRCRLDKGLARFEPEGGMQMKRSLIVRLLTLALSATVLGATTGIAPVDAPGAVEALARLKAGNERFSNDASNKAPIERSRRTALASGQAPFAIVLSCADSRVPPEIVFNTGLGDLFVVRAAGQVIDHSVLASVEYAAEHLNVPLLAVMGHEFCGAVKAAIETKTSLGPNLDFLLKAIKPAVTRTARTPDDQRLKAAIMANVEQVINDGLGKSPILTHLVDSGKLTVVGAFYELASGKVTFSQPIGPVPAAAHKTSEAAR